MKKCLLSLLLLCTLFAGCGKQAIQNGSAQVRFDEVSESQIVQKISGMPEWDQVYNTIYEKTAASDLIVLGEVKDYFCNVVDGQITTHVLVQVDEILQGNAKEGDTVELCNLGGIVTVENYLQSLEESENAALYEDTIKEYEENFTEQERKENYVQCSFCDLEPVIGERSVYFLKKSSDQEYYYRLNEAFGQLVETGDEEFKSAYGVADDKMDNQEPALEPLYSWSLRISKKIW